MKLQDFLKELFSQPAVDGYEISRLEVDIDVVDDILYVAGGSCSKVVIVSREKNET